MKQPLKIWFTDFWNRFIPSNNFFYNLLSSHYHNVLDEWAQAHDVKKVDLLWLDMQAFELKMLKASPKILSTVKLIHTEVSLKETYDGTELYNEYRKFLAQNGFTVLIEAIPHGWDMGNVLFVKK
jgi:Methyltransferase FkbM domain